MFIPFVLGVDTLTDFAAAVLLPETPPIPREQVRHMVFGSSGGVRGSIRDLHRWAMLIRMIGVGCFR